MVIKHKMIMELDRANGEKRIDVMQDDQYSRELELHLKTNGREFFPPDSCTVLVRYQNPNGQSGAYDTLPDGRKAWKICGSIVTVELVPHVCAVAGEVVLMVTLRHLEKELSCFRIYVNVQKGLKTNSYNQQYYHVHGFIPQPEQAIPGEYIKVVSVDQQGNVTAVTTAAEVAQNGKSAFEYAQDNGYRGTEEEFARKMADESRGIHIGTEAPDDATISVWIDTDEEALELPAGKDGKSAYEYAKDGGYTGTEAEFAKLMAGGTGGGGQADWNANEGEAGHVLNRTHYREIVDLLPETTVPLDEAEGVYMFDSNMTFTEGETYFVKWNGVEYTCVAWSVSEDDGEGGTVTIGFIGNKMFMEGEDTGEPFVFANLGALVAYPFDTLPEITASISAYQYRKIPAEYLPSYVVTVLQEHITTGSDNVARMSFDTTELVYALENNIPVWLDISDMKEYVANARLLVIHWDTLYAPLSTQPKDKTFVCLYAYKVGLNQNLCETFTVFVNQDD